jgi:hypothetical protein
MTTGISALIFGIVTHILPPFSGFSILTLNYNGGLLESSFIDLI